MTKGNDKANKTDNIRAVFKKKGIVTRRRNFSDE